MSPSKPARKIIVSLMSQPSDRRQFTRFTVSEEVKIALLVPDQTFTPFSLIGIATDISVGGMKIRVEGMAKKEYVLLGHRIAHVKVKMNIADLGEVIELKGQVVWSDYHDARGIVPAHCYLGIAFYKFTESAQQEFNQLFEQLARVRASKTAQLGGAGLVPQGKK